MHSITIMCFNMKRNYFSFGPHSWQKRAGLIAELIREAKPDIIGTQELTEASLGDLLRLLPEYQHAGEGRGGGQKGEFTAILFRRDRFTLMGQETFWLSKTPERPSRDWTTPFPRICTWCELQPNSCPEKPIRIYNTHLDHLSYFARIHGLKQIFQRIAVRYTNAPGPVVLMGDFNATPTSKTLRNWAAADLAQGEELLRNCYNVMLKTGSLTMGRSYHGFSGKEAGAPIDYIFTSKDMTLEEVEIRRSKTGDHFASDHYPVVARLEI